MTLPVTASGGLNDSLEWTESTPNLGEIHVNTCLDTLGGNQAAGLAAIQSCSDLIQDCTAVQWT